MKKIFTLLLTLSAAFTAWSQSITQAEMPVVNDTLRYSTPANGSVAAPTGFGQSQTWDYSTMTPVSQTLEGYKSAASVNVAYGIFFGFSSYGVKIADSIGIGPVTAYDVYDFYSRNASRFATVGRGLTFQGFPLPANYSDNDEIYTFPLNYADRDSTTFKVTFTAGGQGTLTQQGYRINEAVGSGNLITPFGTFNALLVHVTVHEIDSIVSALIPFPIGFETTTESYVWLSPTHHGAMMSMDFVTGPAGPVVTNVRYRDQYRQLTPVVPEPDFVALQTTLNEGDSTIFVNLTQPSPGASYRWDVTPPTGWNFAFGTSATSQAPVVKFTSGGLYSVSLRVTVQGNSRDTVKTDYITVNGPQAIRPGLQTLSAHPNPADHSLRLTLPASEATRPWLFTDATGRQTAARPSASGTELEFSTENLAPGLYLLQSPPAFGDDGYHLRITVAR